MADTAAEIQRLSLEVTKGIDLPPLPPLAQPKIKADQPWPLVDSRWSFRDQTLSLLESAKYVQDDDGDDDDE